MVDHTARSDALRDPLTGLSTEWHFEIISGFAFGMASRGIPMTLACFAIDGLDADDDGEGRDAALHAFGSLLRVAARQTDVAVRTVDDQFLAMLMDCNLQGGMIFADRVREQAQGFAAAGHTLSVGLATYAKGMSDVAALRSASMAALSAAVASGGDCVKLPEDVA